MSGASSHPDHVRFVRRLDRIADLSDIDRAVLARLPVTVRSFGADQDIIRDGDRPTQCCLILEGFAFRYKLVQDGRRQILSFHIPGDIPDLQSLYLEVMDHSLATLVPTRVAFIAHDRVKDLIRRSPTIMAALWRATLIDAAIFREWITGLGRRTAHQRIAHLLCELLVRLQAVGLADNHACELPITQAELGDALGLSTVHVNRVLRDLQGAGLIVLRDRSLIAQDWAGLREAGDFDPAYLHLKPGLA